MKAYLALAFHSTKTILCATQNSTAIFNRLYRLMKHQSNSHNHGYLVSSVEEGISLIKEGSTKAILGGRETLYFNMKRYGKCETFRCGSMILAFHTFF